MSQSAAGLHRRVDGRRAAGHVPDRLRLGSGRQAVGRRDGRLSPRRGWQEQARRQDQIPSKVEPTTHQPEEGSAAPYDKATLFLDNLGFPTGVTPWGKGVTCHLCPRHLLCRGQRRRRQGRQESDPLYGFQGRQPAAPRQRPGLRPGQLALRRQRRLRRRHQVDQDGADRQHQRP